METTTMSGSVGQQTTPSSPPLTDDKSPIDKEHLLLSEKTTATTTVTTATTEPTIQEQSPLLLSDNMLQKQQADSAAATAAGSTTTSLSQPHHQQSCSFFEEELACHSSLDDLEEVDITVPLQQQLLLQHEPMDDFTQQLQNYRSGSTGSMRSLSTGSGPPSSSLDVVVNSSAYRRRPSAASSSSSRPPTRRDASLLHNNSNGGAGIAQRSFRSASSSAAAAAAASSTIPAPSTGIRASLDAGMAALRRWIRSNHNANSNQQQQQHRHHHASPLALSDYHDDDEESWWNHLTSRRNNTILEVLEEETGDDLLQHQQQQQRQRAMSESDGFRNWSMRRRRRRNLLLRPDRSEGGGGGGVGGGGGGGSGLSSSAAAALYRGVGGTLGGDTSSSLPFQHSSTVRERSVTDSGLEMMMMMTTTTNANTLEDAALMTTTTRMPVSTSASATGENAVSAASTSTTESNRQQQQQQADAERLARMRWIRINRRFQLVITIVALIFSLLLFSILICWVVLTSAYVVSFEKGCDVPLKAYFWLVTLQLVLDVFRSDIMRFVFNWDSSSNQRIPCRVIIYNIAYLIYALMVLRLGIRSVFATDDISCRNTAPELFNASVAFVSLSIAAWTTIVCGYLLPFCVVAFLLTLNGYNPSSSSSASHMMQSTEHHHVPVFPAAYSMTGAPATCIERLNVVTVAAGMENGQQQQECCICMEELFRSPQEVVVETPCKHVFHKNCCRDWLRQSRTCPVCREDIPTHLDMSSNNSTETPRRVGAPLIPVGPTGRPVVGLLRILQPDNGLGGGSSTSNNVASTPGRMNETISPDLEDGHIVGVAGSTATSGANNNSNNIYG